jgi:Na+/H+-dicarboxylate symporter
MLARRGRLSFRYTVGWLVLCLFGITAGVLVPIVQPIAEKMKVTPAAFLSISAMFLLLAICVQISISISGMQEQIRRLTEEAAEIKLRLDEHEAETS